ncbi:MAG TPA: bifunctional hydroxymethylpyrimidine kinase/phosphomethylpyrimidine kinase [Vicinamibacterales bacterium]
MRTALTIAGSDSSGRAGIQADLRTFAAIGVRGTTAITAITAQNAKGVSALVPLEADLVTAQIEAVAADSGDSRNDAGVHATKIGMLANAAIAEAVVAAIEDLELPLVVLDPVLATSGGTRLLDADGVQVLLSELLPRTFVVTPNIPEAEALSGKRITSMDDVREAARRLHRLGARNVIVKGGHAAGAEAVDVLFDGKQFHEARIPRVVCARPVRGTGCSFASAVAAFLALGRPLPDAASLAQRHVAALVAAAQDVY